jgi:hypothetical protein
MTVPGAVAELEPNPIIERTAVGVGEAQLNGKHSSTLHRERC